VSWKVNINGHMTDERPERRPENAMPLLPVVGKSINIQKTALKNSKSSSLSPTALKL